LPGPLGDLTRFMLATKIHFDEDVLLPRASENSVKEYFQINSQGGTTWRSSSLEDQSFPVNFAVFSPAVPFFEVKLDDHLLPSGSTVRRVSIKVPITHTKTSFPALPPRFAGGNAPRPDGQSRPPEGRNSGRRGQGANQEGPPRPRPTEPIERFTPAFFIQCACETSNRDEALTALTVQFHDEAAQHDADAQETLAALRQRLLYVSLVTFAATVIGGCWLVGLGLSPLRRLSDAVSKVSEKDFRLHVDEQRMPGELQPIVGRLEQTFDLLKRAFAREKQAAADISHELRTPLAALMTTIELALRKQRTPDEYREMLKECHLSGQHMSQLVEHLLSLARLDAGVDQLRPQQVDVAELAEQCAALVRPLAEARNLRLAVHCHRPAQMQGDPNKLREVVTNLLHNAIEYNRPDGSIDLDVGRENGTLHVEVRDTGIGIEPKAREHIFERFYRADPSRHAEGLHAGLGLAIVKGYVDLMGGKIAVQSSEGEGSTFRVELPA
jgi:heavy metal sensor kinase